MKKITKLTDLEQDWDYYQKRPVIVQATELIEKEVWIETREGVLKAFKGDFIIKGIQGEIYPCGREIFFKTYAKYASGKNKEK